MTKSLVLVALSTFLLAAEISTNVSAQQITAHQYEELLQTKEGRTILELYISGVGHGAQITNIHAYMSTGRKIWCSPDNTPHGSLDEFLNWTETAVRKTKKSHGDEYGEFPIAQLLIFEMAKIFACD